MLGVPPFPSSPSSGHRNHGAPCEVARDNIWMPLSCKLQVGGLGKWNRGPSQLARYVELSGKNLFNSLKLRPKKAFGGSTFRFLTTVRIKSLLFRKLWWIEFAVIKSWFHLCLVWIYVFVLYHRECGVWSIWNGELLKTVSKVSNHFVCWNTSSRVDTVSVLAFSPISVNFWCRPLIIPNHLWKLFYFRWTGSTSWLESVNTFTFRRNQNQSKIDLYQDMLFQWSMPINTITEISAGSNLWNWSKMYLIDIDWPALVSIPQIWSGIDRYWSALIIDPACPVILSKSTFFSCWHLWTHLCYCKMGLICTSVICHLIKNSDWTIM